MNELISGELGNTAPQFFFFFFFYIFAPNPHKAGYRKYEPFVVGMTCSHTSINNLSCDTPIFIQLCRPVADQRVFKLAK